MPPATANPTSTHQRPLPLWGLFPLFFAGIFLGHLTLLRLPYYWDEGGYYIPSALDFLRSGTLIPHSTITNAHPPLPSILLAGLWKITGVSVFATRTFVCAAAAAALLAVFQLTRTVLAARDSAAETASTELDTAAVAVTVLTALYPVWYVQSTLAHADIFAAAFTLWALALYFRPENLSFQVGGRTSALPQRVQLIAVAVLFSLSVLSKETAIVTPFLLALHRLYLLIREPVNRRANLLWLASLGFCVLPLLAWYAYHRHVTGFVFGNPEYLRYNATANMDAHRTILSLYHRALHLLTHMNMWVALAITAACLILPRRLARTITRSTITTILILIVGNWIAFSVLGGALLTRYLLPVYPLLLLLFVATWRERTRFWLALAAVPTAAFIVALHVNPPYAFAPEDNLTYRDMIVLHQQAVALIEQRFPQATVLTAWPANAELSRPDLGYTTHAIKVSTLTNFASSEIDKAAQNPGDYDTALIFSTKYEPPSGRTNLSAPMQNSDARYFDFHRDLLPDEVAQRLHGQVVWKGWRNGEWAAVLRFPRSFEARVTPEPIVPY